MPLCGSDLRRFVVVIGALCATALATCSANAESDISICGIITDDSTGNPIDQATVRIDGTAFETVSESDGSFALRAVPIGTWSFIVERTGYHRRELKNVDIVEGFSRNLYISLSPAPIVLIARGVEAESIESHGTRRLTIPTNQVGARSVRELLEVIPGVRVYGNSDAPGGTRISVGGEPAIRVAVMLDGLPLSGGSDGAVDLGSIPVSALTAIEVRAGSQSAMAGDAAVGGAVNLITRIDDRSSGIQASLSGGVWGRSRQDLAVAQSLKNWRVSVGGEYDQRRNPYKFIDIKSDTSGMRKNARLDERRAFLRLQSTGRHPFEVFGYASRNERGAPGTVEQPFLSAFTRNKNARIQSSRELGIGRGHRLTAAGWYEFSSEYYNAVQNRIPQHTYLRENFIGARAAHSSSLLSVNWTSEVETRYRFIHGDDFQRALNSFGEKDRAEYSLRTRLSRHMGRISLHGGLALDADPENAPRWSPRFDLNVRPVRNVALGLGWGKSFKRPLLMTAFWKGDYYTLGNPNLLPERAVEWDASARWHHRFITIDSRYFERRIDDIIVWDLRGIPQKYTPVNLSSAHAVGREDHLGLEVGRCGGIDYTHSFNDASDDHAEPSWEGNDITFTPRHMHDLTVQFSTGAISLRGNARWVNRRYILRANTKSQSPYRAFDADLRVTPYKANPSIVVFARAENITNEPIELLQGYPSPTRTLSLGVTVGIK